MTCRCLLYITDDRRRLVDSIRQDGAEVVDTFEGTTGAGRKSEWTRLLSVAHHGNGANEVRVARLSDVPGGVWSWIRELDKLSSLGLQLRSLEEPWLTLGDGQAELIRFLRKSHEQQRSDRIRESLGKVRGKIGRPRVTVDVEALAAYREHNSLRATAKAFGIGASTAHRILAAHYALSETNKKVGS